jgi:hypothetical protein
MHRKDLVRAVTNAQRYFVSEEILMFPQKLSAKPFRC